MNFEVCVSDNVDQVEWNQALKQNKNSMTYQTSNWQKMFYGVYGSKPFFISVLNGEPCSISISELKKIQSFNL